MNSDSKAAGNDFHADDEILTYSVSDEALEAAADKDRGVGVATTGTVIIFVCQCCAPPSPH
jgi:hypothetical protein